MASGFSEMEVQISTSRVREFGYGVLCLVLAAFGWALIRGGKGPVEWLAGGLMLGLFGLGALLFCWRGLPGGQLLVAAGPQGLWVNPSSLLTLWMRTGGCQIPWEEITEVQVREIWIRWPWWTRVELRVRLKDPARLMQRLGLPLSLIHI